LDCEAIDGNRDECTARTWGGSVSTDCTCNLVDFRTQSDPLTFQVTCPEGLTDVLVDGLNYTLPPGAGENDVGVVFQGLQQRQE